MWLECELESVEGRDADKDVGFDGSWMSETSCETRGKSQKRREWRDEGGNRRSCLGSGNAIGERMRTRKSSMRTFAEGDQTWYRDILTRLIHRMQRCRTDDVVSSQWSDEEDTMEAKS